MIRVNVEKCSNLALSAHSHAKVYVNVYARRYSRTFIGKTAKIKSSDPVFDPNRLQTFEVPFVVAGALEFEVVAKTKFHHKVILGTAVLPARPFIDDNSVELLITSNSRFNSEDASITVFVHPEIKPFENVTTSNSNSQKQSNGTNNSSSTSKPIRPVLYIYLESESEADITLSILRFHQLGRYPLEIKRDGPNEEGVRTPSSSIDSFSAQEFLASSSSKATATTTTTASASTSATTTASEMMNDAFKLKDVFELDPEAVNPFYFTPLVHCNGYSGTVKVNIVSDVSPKESSMDFRIVRSAVINVSANGYYSSGVIVWPRSGAFSFIGHASKAHDELSVETFAPKIAPFLKKVFRNGALTQDVRRRFYYRDDETYSFTVENMTDFTGVLFPAVFDINISFVHRVKEDINLSVIAFDGTFHRIEENALVGCVKRRSCGALTVRLQEVPESVKCIAFCSKSDVKLNSQARLAITDSDSGNEVAASNTFIARNNHLKVLSLFYRIHGTRWSSIEGQDWLSTHDDEKAVKKVAKIAQQRLMMTNREQERIRKHLAEFQNM